MHIKCGCLLLVAAIAFTAPCAADVVVNGGFETGDFTGWTGGFPDNFVASGNPFFIHSGTYGVAFGATSLSYLSQTLTTTAGTNYDVSFWLNSNGPDNQVTLSWGGNSIFNQSNIAADGWTKYSFTETATSSSTLLSFGLEQISRYSGLDDISVTPTSAVPEPSTWAMMLLGFGGIYFLANGRKWRKPSASLG